MNFLTIALVVSKSGKQRMLGVGVLLLGWAMLGYAEENTDTQSVGNSELNILLNEGENLRNNGNLLPAQKKFDLAMQLAEKSQDINDATKAAIYTASGYNLFLLDRKDLAEKQLLAAYAQTADNLPYLHALTGEYLGSLSISNGDVEQAASYFDQALQAAKNTSDQALILSLVLLSISVNDEADPVKLDQLLKLSPQINQLTDANIKTKLQLMYSQRALDIESKDLPQNKVQRLNQALYQMLTEVLKDSVGSGQERIRAETLLSLAKLYRANAKNADALMLIEQAIDLANQAKVKELLAQLHAQKGDLLHLQGDNNAALNAYELAVNDLQEIRPDLPLTFPDGRSAITVLIDPIHRNYADLLLRSTAGKDKGKAREILYKAIGSMEIIKEADMQDFFLGKCGLNTAKQLDWKTSPLLDAAIVYPIILPDRLEVIVKTDQDIWQRTIPVAASEVKQQITAFGIALQSGKPFRNPAQTLYDWLLKPVKEELQNAHIRTLIYVPDREMRTIPYAAFNDGKHFVVEDFGVVTMPSLAFQNFGVFQHEKAGHSELFAGLSVADGPSIDKLPKKMVAEITNAENNEKGLAALSNQRSVLSETLSLPSVEKEIKVLSADQPSKILMNGDFTTTQFKANLESGNYSKVHIASHGYFGNNAKDSFILAYDEVLSLADFQHSLSVNILKQNPINLLTLSACETAQGNDRMLLGFSGMAIKSNVQSALGSLWPIDDEAAMEFMKIFYAGVNQQLGKAQALQEAQIAMIKSGKFKHPYYWSPFILTGSWH